MVDDIAIDQVRPNKQNQNRAALTVYYTPEESRYLGS